MTSQPVLIYDGDCPLCRASIDWIRQRERAPGFETITCQSEERAERFPELPEEECMRAVQLIEVDGERYSGADALPKVLLRLRAWRWAAWAFRLPLISHAAPWCYAYVARNRKTFSLFFSHDDACDCSIKDSGQGDAK